MLSILWNEKLYLGFVNYFYFTELTGIHEVTQETGENKKAEVQKSHHFLIAKLIFGYFKKKKSDLVKWTNTLLLQNDGRMKCVLCETVLLNTPL